MDKNKQPKLNKATLTPEQRDRLELWQQAHDQLRTLNDIANIVQDISTTVDDQKKGDTSEKMGALLVDMRDSLNELKSKEDPETPDFSTPVVKAVANLEKAIKSIEVKPQVSYSAPDINVAPAKVDLTGVEKAMKGIPKAFSDAIKQIPKPEKTDNSQLLKAWDGISEQLVSLENATRMKPLPGSMSIKGITITNGSIPVFTGGFGPTDNLTITDVDNGTTETITITNGVITKTVVITAATGGITVSWT